MSCNGLKLCVRVIIRDENLPFLGPDWSEYIRASQRCVGSSM